MFFFFSSGIFISIDGRILAQKSLCPLDIWTDNNVVWSLKDRTRFLCRREMKFSRGGPTDLLHDTSSCCANYDPVI